MASTTPATTPVKRSNPVIIAIGLVVVVIVVGTLIALSLMSLQGTHDSTGWPWWISGIGWILLISGLSLFFVKSGAHKASAWKIASPGALLLVTLAVMNASGLTELLTRDGGFFSEVRQSERQVEQSSRLIIYGGTEERPDVLPQLAIGESRTFDIDGYVIVNTPIDGRRCARFGEGSADAETVFSSPQRGIYRPAGQQATITIWINDWYEPCG